MVYVTGDLHGDLERLKQKSTRKLLKKGDTLICCGDFGFLWDGGKKEKKALRWISKQKYTLLFVEGTHDNLELLSQCEEMELYGGKVRKIADHIYQLCRGQIFELEGKRIFAFGGGESSDSDYRVSSSLWWPQELPDSDEIEATLNFLKENGCRFDYAVTHDCSASVKGFIDMDSTDSNHLNVFFDQVEALCTFRCWFFGCYHLDKMIPPYHRALFHDVAALK